MMNLVLDHGAPFVGRSLRYLFKRLSGGPATKKLAADVAKAREALEAQLDKLEDAELDAECATSEITMLSATLIEAFKPLSLGLNSLVLGAAEDPRRRQLFADTPSQALAGPAQEAFVDGVLEVLATNPAFKTLQLLAKPIAGAQAALRAKRLQREQLLAKAVAARSAVRAAVSAACEVHNTTEPKLKLALGTTKRYVIDSYFLAGKKPAKSKVAAIEPV